MTDTLNATFAIAAIVAALAAAMVTAAFSGTSTTSGRLGRAIATLLGSFVLTAIAVLVLRLFDIGPFEQRSVSIKSGAGDVACTTELAGSVKVPENEAAWILLVNETGDFYPQGPSGHGAPVAVGGESRDWKLPGVRVSDQYFAGATYQVVGIIVPLADSLRLQQLLVSTDHLGADQIPSRLLSTDVQQAKLTSAEGCTS